jgi:quercetin dioxygenase-like cupin family protein
MACAPRCPTRLVIPDPLPVVTSVTSGYPLRSATIPATIHNAQTGEHITFLSDGVDILRMHFLIDGGGLVAAEHRHPQQEERFEVASGTLRMRLDGQEREVPAGDRVVVPAGTRHAWWNASSSQAAEVRIELEPALESKAFFEALFQLVEDGHTTDGMPRNPLRLAVLAQRYRQEVEGVPAEGDPLRMLPAPALRGLIRAMAFVGRALGYRAGPR